MTVIDMKGKPFDAAANAEQFAQWRRTVEEALNDAAKLYVALQGQVDGLYALHQSNAARIGELEQTIGRWREVARQERAQAAKPSRWRLFRRSK